MSASKSKTKISAPPCSFSLKFEVASDGGDNPKQVHFLCFRDRRIHFVLDKIDGESVFAMVSIVERKDPFMTESAVGVFLGFGAKCCRDVEPVVRGQSCSVSVGINRGNHVAVLKTPCGHGDGCAC